MNLLHEFFNSKSDANGGEWGLLHATQQEQLEKEFGEWEEKKDFLKEERWRIWEGLNDCVDILSPTTMSLDECYELIFKNKRPEIETSFQMACLPLMKFLAENYHPHTKAIIENNRAELLQGIDIYLTDEFLTD